MAVETIALKAMYALIIIIVVLIVGGGVIGTTYLILNFKRYIQFMCLILKADGTVSFDTAGIFEDKKTKTKRFFMKKNKVGLTPDKVPSKIIDGPTGFFQAPKIVFLAQTGLKNFHFIDLKIGFNKLLSLKVGEEDVNWALHSYEKGKALGQIKNKLLEFMPYISIAVVSVIILILFIFLFKKFDVMADMATAIEVASENLVTAATRISEAGSGTKIIQ